MSPPRTTLPSDEMSHWLPSPALLVGLTLAALVVGVTLAKGLQDADYFWHVTAGELIATTGRVPSTDPFSFTWAGQPWTPHEWLSEVLIYWLVSGIGTTGALVVFGLVAATVPVVTALALERRGVRTLPIAIGAVVAVLVTFPYLTVRPQAISWALMAGLLWYLLELRPDRPWRLALLPPMFALWANLHGLYVVGFGFIGLYALFTLAGRTPMAPRRGLVLVAVAGAILASMLTPAGPAGLLYPLRYVEAGDWGLANIQEWGSPDFHNPAHWPLLGMVIAIAVAGSRGAPGWLTTLSYVTLAMALVSLRNAPIAATVGGLVIAMGIDARLPARERQRSARQARARRYLEIGVAAVVIIAGLLILVPRDPAAASAETIAGRYPVASLDLLASADPDARVLADYGWGGYVISRIYPAGGRVFVDGRNDMYDQSILEDYSAVRAADPGWEEIVDRYEVDALLFPPGVTITRGPAQAAGWCEAYGDEVQVLLLRQCPPGS
jgi:hypothetical protein